MKLPQLYDTFREKWEQYSDIYLISDTHFNDEELYAKTKRVGRPDAEQYIKLINSKVGKKSILIHLGDVGDLEIMKRIRGYKILIMGNHDTGVTKYKDIFDEVYTGPLIIGERLILSHEPVDVPWAFNIHGHVHSGVPMSDERHFNVCGEARKCYEPINLNQFIKAGFLSKVQSIHRETIDNATKRARKREKKNKEG